MSFTYDGEYVYLHTQNPDNPLTDEMQAEKIELMKKHSKHNYEVCLEFDVIGPTMPPDKIREKVKKAQGCYWDLSYAYVIGYGMIELLTDKEVKFRALEQRVSRYTGKGHHIPDAALADVAIWRIKLDREKTFSGYRFVNIPGSN